MWRVFVLLILLPISGCMAQSKEGGAIQAQLYGLKVESRKIQIQVESKGCTQPDSFELLWRGKKLFINRIKVDNCKRLQRKVWLQYPLPQTIHKFSVMNPIIM